MALNRPQKVIVVGAGPVGALAALYAAGRGDHVEVYELRAGMSQHLPTTVSSFLLELLVLPEYPKHAYREAMRSPLAVGSTSPCLSVE